MNRCYCKTSVNSALFRQALTFANGTLSTAFPSTSQLRTGSNFINSKTAAELWQGVTPHDQKKHSGGKRLIKKAVKDLNLGRPVGTGKLGIHWPGLNAPVKIQHYNEVFKDAFESGSTEIPVSSDSHGLTRSWLQVKKDAFRLIPNQKPRREFSAISQENHQQTSCGKSKSIKMETTGSVEAKRSFSTSASPFAPSERSQSGGGGGNRSRFNTIRVDKPLGSLKEIQEAQIAKFDAADKSIRKKSYNAPLSIRGWTSKSLGGLTVGKPEEYKNVDYEGFQTKILKVKRVGTMKGNKGRNYRKWVLVVVGNYNGLVGYAFGKAEQMTQAVKIAKKSASKRLMFVEKFDNSTLFTDSTVDVDRTTVHMRRMHHGGGLKCSRVIREILILAGFTDVYAKIEGPSNTLKVVRAVFQVLANQKTHQQLADEKKLHVVLFRDDFPYYPILLGATGPLEPSSLMADPEHLASPSDGETLPGTNIAPEGELTDEELQETVYSIDHKRDKHTKKWRFYGIEPKIHPLTRPGILVPKALKSPHLSSLRKF